MMAAKWLGVAPWELAEQPADWLAAAQTVMAAEGGAAAERAKAAERRAKMPRRRGA